MAKNKMQRWMDDFLGAQSKSANERKLANLQNARLCHVPQKQFDKDMALFGIAQKQSSAFVIDYYEKKLQTKLDGVEIIDMIVMWRE
jgi:hypothetical protein